MSDREELDQDGTDEKVAEEEVAEEKVAEEEDAGKESNPQTNADLGTETVIDSIAYLFKLCLKIEDISGEKLKGCQFQASFLLLPITNFKVNEEKGVLFPLNKNNFAKSQAPILSLSAISNEHTIATAELDVTKEFRKLEEEYESYPDCCPVHKQENVFFILGAEKIGEAKVSLQFICIGRSKAEDSEIPAIETPSESSVGNIASNKSLCEDVEPEFDEYFADINGNALNIRIMRKNDKQEESMCDCERGGGQAIPSGGIGRRGSQVIFQMPTKLELCTKHPPNAMSYNVGNCLKRTEHGHGTDKMRIGYGKSQAVIGTQKVDKFVLKIGKKDSSADSKGRVELEIFAPKLLTEEDFKKPCQARSAQTEDDKGKKKRNK